LRIADDTSAKNIIELMTKYWQMDTSKTELVLSIVGDTRSMGLENLKSAVIDSGLIPVSETFFD